MTDTTPPSSEDISQFADFGDNDVIQPFELDSSNLRGRMIRLGPVLDDILTAHDYPNPVAHLVAETATLALMLSSMLKYEGIFTLQAQGDGPVKMVVADVTTSGEIRACASFDEDRIVQSSGQVKALRSKETSQNHLAQLLGKGYIAFTVDQGGHAERYQGIVELKGSSLVDCVQHYFAQSEQIGTGIKMAAGKRGEAWRAGGIMLQHMPEDERQVTLGNQDEDDWRRAMILMDSATEDELLDADLHSKILLTRLFHEEGVRVYTPTDIVKTCRCDEDRVLNILRTMEQDDLDYMMKDGEISMRCEFCSKDYTFDPKEISKIITPS